MGSTRVGLRAPARRVVGFALFTLLCLPGRGSTSLLPTLVTRYAGSLISFCAEGGKPMPESSPSQLINDWVIAAKSATPNNAPSVAKTIAGFYTSDAVLCATPEGIVKGRTAIGNDYEQNFGAGWVLTEIPNPSVHLGAGQEWAWAYGKWKGAFKGTLTGCWSIVCVNQGTSARPDWLIQQHTIVTDQQLPAR